MTIRLEWKNGCMHRIEFVVAPDAFGPGEVLEAVEPVIDGRSLIDVVKRADGVIAFAGLTPPERYVGVWRSAIERDHVDRMPVLGCGCGWAECSHVAVRCSVGPHLVVWSDFTATLRPSSAPAPDSYPELGRYEFGRRQYEDALATLAHRPSPIRDAPDYESLAAGVPGDPAGWLREATMAFGRDFLWSGQPERTRAVIADGLRALRARGSPVTENDIRTWAGDPTRSEVEQYVEWFRQLPP